MNCEINLKPFIVKMSLLSYYFLPFTYKYSSLTLCYQMPLTHVLPLRVKGQFPYVLMSAWDGKEMLQ